MVESALLKLMRRQRDADLRAPQCEGEEGNHRDDSHHHFVHMTCITTFLQMEDATVHSTDSRARNSEGSSGEAILVLGGEPERDTFAIELWKTMDMRFPIFVNSPGGGAEQRLKPALDVQMVELSWKAVDTDTNFFDNDSSSLGSMRFESLPHDIRLSHASCCRRSQRHAEWERHPVRGHVVCSDAQGTGDEDCSRCRTSMALAYHRMGFEVDRAQTDSASTAWFSAGTGKDNALEQLVLFWCLSVLFSNYNCKDNSRADP